MSDRSNYDGSDMPVPKSQQKAMLDHLYQAEQDAQMSIRRARTGADMTRALQDLEGVQIIKDRVTREWNVK